MSKAKDIKQVIIPLSSKTSTCKHKKTDAAGTSQAQKVGGDRLFILMMFISQRISLLYLLKGLLLGSQARVSISPAFGALSPVWP